MLNISIFICVGAMRKISVITSFNQSYYDKVGKHCVETFNKFWDEDIDLFVYLEDMDETRIDAKCIPFTNLPIDYFVFQQEKRKQQEKTFAKKAYSIIHAFKNLDTDILIWLDADVVTTKSITKEFIYSLVPENTLSAHFGVWHNRVKHDNESPLIFSCETGFFAVNTKHKLFSILRDRYTQRYLQRDTSGLRRFYDGDVYGAVIKELEDSAIMNDLNSGPHKTPIPRSVLGEYITHFKHGLKKRNDFNIILEKTLK